MGDKRKKRNLLRKFRKSKELLKIVYEPGLDIKKVFEYRKKLIDSKYIVQTELR